MGVMTQVDPAGYTLVDNPSWTLADRLRKARQLADMEQSDIARVIDVARNTVSNWERGRSEPSATYFVKWARATGVSLDWLAGSHNAETASTEVETVSDDGAPEGTRTPNLLIGSLLDDEWAFWSIVEPLIERQGNPDTEIANVSGSAL